jgi:predicted nucleotidyltransferase
VEKHALSDLGAIFAALGIRWVLIGALAANRYRGAPRMTEDIDVLIDDAKLDRDALEQALRDHGWDARRADPHGELMRLRHPTLGVADILVAGTDYQREAILRARQEPLDGTPIPVLRIEDVIVHKLIAGRTQDIADIEAILATRPSFDRGFVERWAEFWELTDRWRAVSAALNAAE